MHFAKLIPFWNSLDSVRRAHSDLELAALVFFALLVLFDILAHLSEDKPRERLLEKIGLIFFAVAVFAEILAYPYGQRNDNLSAEKIKSLDAEAGDALSKAREAHGIAQSASDIAMPAKTEADEAKTKAGAVGKRVEDINRDLSTTQDRLARFQLILKERVEEAVSDREVVSVASSRASDDQPRRVAGCTEVKKYTGTIAIIQSVQEREPRTLAEEIARLLQFCGWVPEMLDESQTHVPNSAIWPGVALITLQEPMIDPSAKSPRDAIRKDWKPSTVGLAAFAGWVLLSVDLGPPYGPGDGVHPEFEYNNDRFRHWTRWGFSFPSNSVLILVGTKPADTFFPPDLLPRLGPQKSTKSNHKTIPK